MFRWPLSWHTFTLKSGVLKGRNAEAVKVLRAAISLGYKDFDWMRHDPDLDGIHKYTGFIQLLSDLEIG